MNPFLGNWQEKLAKIDAVMRAISTVTDPEELVNVYWNGIDEFMPFDDYVALSRRGVEAPSYLITRSSRFTEHPNPWKQRERLPKLAGGILGEIVYANAPVYIDDLQARLRPDDPAHFYLQGFRALISAPIYDNGESINCSVILLKPDEEFDPSIIPILHWQAGLFGRGTHNLVLRNQLSEALATLDRELQTIGQIQRSLLPQQVPLIPSFELATYYHTSARAGGDYYDLFPLDDGRWGVFIADVSGHGAPAAVLMAITHAIVHSEPSSHASPRTLLDYLNTRLLRSYTQGGAFVTAFYGVLDPATGTLVYSIAGHPGPRLVRDGGIIAVDEEGGLPLGITPDARYAEASITLRQRDMLLLYTDGITEAMPPPRVDSPRPLFGVERVDALLLDCDGSASSCIERIRDEVDVFCEHAPAVDDQTLILLRCIDRPQAPSTTYHRA